MKILFFSSYFYPYISGITTYPFKILSHLSKKNKITVLTFLHDNKLPKKEKINGFKIVRMPFLLRIYKGFISPQSIFYFLKEIKKNDLILINVPNVEGLLLVIFSKLFRKKVISIFHCYLGYNEKIYLKIINFITNLIITIQLILSNQIIGYTEDYINHLPIANLIKKKTKIVLPPIYKLSIKKKIYQQYLKIKNKKILIGYSGRISQEKGLEYLIEAIKEIKNIKVIFAGPFGKQVAGENLYYLKIKKILEENKIDYQFLGNLEGEKLGAFYKIIDILVLPSINRTEAFGMVQPEAMLLGTPVVASNLPGIRTAIQLTKMGILTEVKNSNHLKNAILKVLKNKNKFSNKKLIKKAEKIFNINKVYKFYEKLINEKN